MAPAQSSRRGAQAQSAAASQSSLPNQQPSDSNVNPDLFIDPMLGTPLSVYIEKDVDDKDELVRLVTAYGGAVSPGYSGVTYILVDPHKTSGQNLYRQYAGKKTKIVLNARWIRECIRANQLQTFSTQWAGCKVTGEEQVLPPGAVSTAQTQEPMGSSQQQTTSRIVEHLPRTRTPPGAQSGERPSQSHAEAHPPPHASTSQARDGLQPPPPQPVMSYPMPPIHTILVDPSSGFPHSMYGHPMHPPPHMPFPGPWPPPHMHGPLPPHLVRPPSQPYRDDQQWDYTHHHQDGVAPNPTYPGEYRYRENHPPWLPPTSATYYDPNAFDPAYAQPTYMPEPPPPAQDAPVPMAVEEPQPALPPPIPQPEIPNVGPSTGTLEPPERTRGRKRTRAPPPPATPATELVNRSTPARSPTPPARVIKSTYGGNLFTSDDILYLKKYIDYCREQGLVLSLREICERVAVKAPHHTFYSWRRYCNKHQIKLGGYVMNNRGDSPAGEEGMNMDIEEESNPMPNPILQGVPGPSTSRHPAPSTNPEVPERLRTPSPPRALFRSTTGKGVAFTQEDINFLLKFLKYRESQGRVDMVQFWRDVATKAPHHSRASWMKFWRRHKHELLEGDDYEGPPPPLEKKKRYSREDDILLAKFQFEKPEGTSDKLFQAFARAHPHHPWKGWQEHYRLHKAKIDHLVEQLQMGKNIDDELEDEE